MNSRHALGVEKEEWRNTGTPQDKEYCLSGGCPITKAQDVQLQCVVCALVIRMLVFLCSEGQV